MRTLLDLIACSTALLDECPLSNDTDGAWDDGGLTVGLD